MKNNIMSADEKIIRAYSSALENDYREKATSEQFKAILKYITEEDIADTEDRFFAHMISQSFRGLIFNSPEKLANTEGIYQDCIKKIISFNEIQAEKLKESTDTLDIDYTIDYYANLAYASSFAVLHGKLDIDEAKQEELIEKAINAYDIAIKTCSKLEDKDSLKSSLYARRGDLKLGLYDRNHETNEWANSAINDYRKSQKIQKDKKLPPTSSTDIANANLALYIHTGEIVYGNTACTIYHNNSKNPEFDEKYRLFERSFAGKARRIMLENERMKEEPDETEIIKMAEQLFKLKYQAAIGLEKLIEKEKIDKTNIYPDFFDAAEAKKISYIYKRDEKKLNTALNSYQKYVDFYNEFRKQPEWNEIPPRKRELLAILNKKSEIGIKYCNTCIDTIEIKNKQEMRKQEEKEESENKAKEQKRLISQAINEQLYGKRQKQ